MRLLFWPIALSAVACASEPSGVVGPSECAPCHAAQFAAQTRTHHYAALHRIAGGPWLATDFKDRGFAIEYRAAGGDAIDATAYGPLGTATLRLEWAFGAGAQGITPV